MPVFTHLNTFSLQYESICSASVNVALSIFQVQKLPDPEDPLSETLPSVSIKAANEAMLNNRRSDHPNQCCSFQTRSKMIFANICSGKQGNSEIVSAS